MHETEIRSTRNETVQHFWAYCHYCHSKSMLFNTEGEADKWSIQHIAKTSTGSLYSGARKPNLKTIAAHYREEADNPLNSPEERKMWDTLAQELDRYIPILNTQEPTLF